MITTANGIESSRRTRRVAPATLIRARHGQPGLGDVLSRFIRVSRKIEERSRRLELSDAEGDRILRSWRAAVIDACDELHP